MVGVLLALWPVPAADAAVRVLYASAWSGPTQIYAADPSGRLPVRQVTFDRPGPCRWAAACGFTRPLPSPDGRRLAYWTGGADFEPATLWLARADGTGARAIGVASDAAWAPDSRRLAYSAAGGLHVLTTGGRDRIVDPRNVNHVRFSPDGRAIAFVGGPGLVLLRAGHARTLAASAQSFAWSPDGRTIAFTSRRGISLLDVASRRTRLVVRPRNVPESFNLLRIGLAWSPNGRQVAFALGGIRVLDTHTLRTRTLTRDSGRDLAWSADGRTLLYAQGFEDISGDAITTGDVRTVTLTGRVRVVVSGSKPYGGQIVAAAWTKVGPGVRYRAPQSVDGMFAGGPVQELVADGTRVGFVACAGVAVWTPSSGSVVKVARGVLAGCQAAFNGTGCLSSAPVIGTGTAVGAGTLLVRSAWRRHSGPDGMVTDEQAIERVEPGGCPCTALSSSPGPYTPLDVDAGRIVVSGENETRILDSDGTILASLPVPTQAAQLSSSDLVLAAGEQLRVYEAATATLRSAWPLPAPAGHTCDFNGDPSCRVMPVTLDDVARGLAVYVYDGQVHVLRLADGADRAVAAGTIARFMDAGLVYSDGARIRLTPWDRLPG